jgi:hypothetical protein
MWLLAWGGLLGLAAAAPAPKDKAPVAYFPTRTGDTWVYELRTPTATAEMTEAITRVDEKDGELVVSISRTYQSETVPVSRVAVSDKGVRRLSAGGRDLREPYWIVKLPVKAGDSWSVDQSPPPGVRTTYTVHGEEEVEVPAGKFKAIRVDSVTGGSDGKGFKGSFWYAPALGLVRSVTPVADGDRVQSLKTFSPAKK